MSSIPLIARAINFLDFCVHLNNICRKINYAMPKDHSQDNHQLFYSYVYLTLDIIS